MKFGTKNGGSKKWELMIAFSLPSIRAEVSRTLLSVNIGSEGNNDLMSVRMNVKLRNKVAFNQ